MTVEELAKEYTEAAFNKLAELIQSDNPKMALEASTQMLDRAWGRSVDRVAIQQVGNNVTDPSSMDMDALRHQVNNLLERKKESLDDSFPPDLPADYTEVED